MDPIFDAVALAVSGGVAGAVSEQLWLGLWALVRRPSRHQVSHGGQDVTAVVRTAATALEAAPHDAGRARALVEALRERATHDADFAAELERWARSATEEPPGGQNVINGGAFHGPVIQGRDFSGPISL
jgi:hypothetical protein